MLSEEDMKAVRNLENLSEFGLSATLNQADLDKMKTVLNLITKLQKENKEKDKEINNLKIENNNAWEDWNSLEQSSYEEELRLKKRIKEKEKQIDLMAEMIDELSEYYTRYNGKNNEFCKEICIEKDIDCIDCIKQYFETKAKKEL